jgi:Methyltransferase FkbM domain
LVKIDVEGNGGCCLKGAQRVLTDARPYVVCEVHDPSQLSEVLTVLAQFSYEIKHLDPRLFIQSTFWLPLPRA